MGIDWLILAINVIILQNNFELFVAENATISTVNITYLNDSTTTLQLETSSPNVGGVTATSTTNSAETQEKIPLYIGGIFSFGGLWDGSGILPAVEMGLDHINNRVDILPEYELRMVWNDSQVFLLLLLLFLFLLFLFLLLFCFICYLVCLLQRSIYLFYLFVDLCRMW